MLFKVEMDVVVPTDVDQQAFEELKGKEKAYAQSLQEKGVWRHLWRIAGQYQNVSIFDVDSVDQLHETLMSLPLYPYINLNIVALCRHPSSIRADDS
ncbi:muconolactone Delta-isomerase [Arenicella sp.]|nr:muconolactone Delta-isomerase [Arenicella sp.]